MEARRELAVELLKPGVPDGAAFAGATLLDLLAAGWNEKVE